MFDLVGLLSDASQALPRDFLQKLVDYSKAAESLSKVAAVLVGGYWTYRLFIRKREKFPRAEISHQVVVVEFEHRTVVHVTVTLKNIGGTLVVLDTGFCRIQRVKPLDMEVEKDETGENIEKPISLQREPNDSEIGWKRLQECPIQKYSKTVDVEPGETQEFVFDFPILPNVEIVKVYSYLQNASIRGKVMGWAKRSFVDLKKPDDPMSAAAPKPTPASQTEKVYGGGWSPGVYGGELAPMLMDLFGKRVAPPPPPFSGEFAPLQEAPQPPPR